MKSALIIILFLVALNISVFAQKDRIKFETISLEQGLSQSTVTSIVQDDKGFMWFGTLDGLNKYDGYAMKIYRYSRIDTTSISDNSITTLFKDSQNNLWVGTLSGGVCIFDRLNERFIRIKSKPITNNSLSDNNIKAIYEDEFGNIWLGTSNGLNKYNPQTKEFTNFYAKKNTVNSLTSNTITSIIGDKSGNIWIGTNKGLNKYNLADNEFTNYKHLGTDTISLDRNYINKLFIDSDGVLWLGTNYGLMQMDQRNRSIISYIQQDNGNSISDNVITSIAEDNNKILWIGTQKGGLNRFDKQKNEFSNYVNDPSDNSSLSVNNIHCIFKDKTNILWIGTSLGGINKWNRAAEDLNVFRHNPYDPNSLSSNQIRTIYQDRTGKIWIGTVDGGLNEWNTQENKFIHYKHNSKNSLSISHNHVRSILEDNDGNFWIGTDGGGLNLFNRNKKTFKHFRFDENNSNSISSDKVWKIYQDSKGNLWIGTFGGGLNLFTPKNQTFKTYKKDPKNIWSLCDNRVTTIHEDRNGNLWIGTYGGGLSKWEANTESFIPYKFSERNSKSIGSNRVYSIFEDSEGILWIGTKGCLNRFDIETQEFTRYDEADGFPNDVIMGILEDSKGNLWISTNRGLSKFNKKTEEIRNYDVRDGLQSNEFLVGSFCKSRDGEMFFGGINGFNAFYPEKINDNPHPPAIVITGFRIFNSEVELDSAISEKNILYLSYRDYSFSFDFVALDYIFPEKNQYAYKMEGFEKDWNFVGNRRFASYTNLPPSKYVFKVIGSNNDEVWNETGTSITIIIEPAFWQTTWFKIAMGLLVIFIILTIYKVRVRNIKKQNEYLEEQVKERTVEIVQKNEEITAQRDQIEAHKVEVEKQRDHIIEINKEMTDSILYAERIQEASLPRKEFLDDILKDYFIMFRPKDIVSGDFYWASKHHGKLIIAAADCTGHGVPGAFMSMFGVSFLNKIVNEKEQLEPGIILDKLRENIIDALQQKGLENETRDGMDIALCTIDFDARKLEFAGANNPLYFVRNHEASVIRGDRMPIAIYDNMRPFKTHTIQIQEGDMVYIFSDGYPDQFGGTNGKKFMYKRFRNFLTSNSHLHTNEQKLLLEENFDNWCGELEQIDDVVVIGLRIHK